MSRFLNNSRVLITGGAGFVGSTITDQLLKEDVKEIVIVDNFIRGKHENIKQAMASGKVTLVEGDIRDQQLLRDAFAGIDYCFHLAALRITHCAAEPREALTVMYDGTFNVLEACVARQVKKILFASSASIYGQAAIFPTSEQHHPYNNYTLYGAAKMANELMLRSFQHMYGLDFNAARYFNIYGPRMDTHGKYTEVLIRWYRLVKEGKQPLIFGDGSQTMDFVFIEDIARASILALQADACNEVFNIASGVETSLKQLCYALLEVMQSDLQPEYVSLPEDRKKVEVMRRLADTRKMKNKINFSTEVGLADGLTKLVAWLDQRNMDG
ncbi:MAG: NAD-dependent epimerase/dehydratase family protein [Candidatus Omnitrophica bacterium]|nr:NAD-dependent epimerase/dehydratase family protein [Candidatus Omnitrophota bacterium]